jgi:hypothetical protein
VFRGLDGGAYGRWRIMRNGVVVEWRGEKRT